MSSIRRFATGDLVWVKLSAKTLAGRVLASCTQEHGHVYQVEEELKDLSGEKKIFRSIHTVQSGKLTRRVE